MKKIIIAILTIAILAGLAVLGYQKFQSTTSSLPVVETQAGLFVDTSTANTVVMSPLVVSGHVDGTNRWTGFEGQVGSVTLLDGNGKILDQKPLTATTDWMQFPINFSTTLNFSSPTTSVGTLVFKNENASGLPDYERNSVCRLSSKLTQLVILSKAKNPCPNRQRSFTAFRMTNNMTLQDKAKNLPLSPGVYIWLGKDNKPLYVGRATSLRRRVLQYFRPDIDPRIGEMVSLAGKIKYHETPTVLEAIILEANLIKKFWPKYNVKDKDNRSFVYIVFPKTDFPKPIVVRGRELESFPASSAKIFGPYQSLTLVRNALKVIRRIFPYSTCKPMGKPCFDYQVGLCPGVCVGAVSKQDYQKNIGNIMLLLKGEKKKLLKKLTKENPMAALALKHFQDVTLIEREDFTVGDQKFNRIEGYDISHFAGKEVYGSMVVFTGGKPDKSQYRLFKIRTVGNNDLDALKEMMERRLKHSEWPRPDLILIDGGKPQVDYIFKVIEQHQVAVPLLGISKLNGDRLVFPPKSKSTLKDLAETIKTTLQGVRDEAHRFANRGRSRRYFKDNFSG